MEYNENKYSSFDLMKIFGIKKGSWQNIKKKFNLDSYGERIFDSQQNQFKYIYSQKAYDVLKENYQQKINEEVKESPRMLALVTENNALKATIEEYKNINTKFEQMYKEEKEKNEKIIEEKGKLAVKLEREMQDRMKNQELACQRLEDLERLKKRGLIARILNRD